MDSDTGEKYKNDARFLNLWIKYVSCNLTFPESVISTLPHPPAQHTDIHTDREN